MLTANQYQNLWNIYFQGLPQVGQVPPYCEYLDRAHMYEDYVDIFRGVNTRSIRPIQPCNGWYYDHPFFDQAGNPKVAPSPGIKYIMIGEAAPGVSKTYFYNINHLNHTAWLSAPVQAFNIPLATPPAAPLAKERILIALAKEGYLLIDIFPFAISYSTEMREALNGNGASTFFFINNVINSLNGLVGLYNRNPIMAFSGPQTVHHFLVHNIDFNNLRNLVTPFGVPGQRMGIFDYPNSNGALPFPPLKPIGPLPSAMIGAGNTQPLLNGVYPLNALALVPFYRCCCYDGSRINPNQLFIRNAFGLP
jgi:hypothetical protein